MSLRGLKINDIQLVDGFLKQKSNIVVVEKKINHCQKIMLLHEGGH